MDAASDGESTEARVASLEFNLHGQDQIHHRLRRLEELVDVQESPLWKLALFALDGWPLRRIVAKPQWRPWHRWWIS